MVIVTYDDLNCIEDGGKQIIPELPIILIDLDRIDYLLSDIFGIG